MAVVVPILGAFGLYVFVVYIYRWRQLVRQAKQHNAALPRLQANLDPLFALDEILRQARGFIASNRLEIACGDFARHGPTFSSLRFGRLGPVNTCDPINIQTVWAGRHTGSWGVGPGRLHEMEPFCGRGFANADGGEWERSRAMVKMSLKKEAVFDMTHFNRALAALFEQVPADGQTVDLQPLFGKLFLDTATHFLFGQAAGTLTGSSSEDMEEFLGAFRYGMMGCGARIVLGPLKFVTRWTKFPLACSITQDFVEKYVRQTQALRSSLAADDTDDMSASPQRNTLLYHMAGHTGNRSEMRDTIIQSLMAALDTTAILPANVLWLLARHPELYADLRTEVLQALQEQANAKGTSQEQWLDPPGLQNLTLLRAILHETMRLHPVFPVMNRIALKDTTLPRGGGPDGSDPIFVPKGTTIFAHWHRMHRTPGAWGGELDRSALRPADSAAEEKIRADAETLRRQLPLSEFQPARWKGVSPSSVPFMPFGAGYRRCLGQDKALLEASALLAAIAARYKTIHPGDQEPFRAKVTLSSVNVNGCRVGLCAA